MNAEIIAVGTELLMGDICNANAQYISKKLSELGIFCYYHTVCGDNPERLSKAIDIALSRSEIVITTGGLGPTYDDLTKETIAKKMHQKLVLNEIALNQIKDFFKRVGKEMAENNIKQAMMPEKSIIFFNDWGTAPACAIENKGKHVIMLPGPPREMQPIFEKYCVPYLEKLSKVKLYSYNLRVIGIGESALEEMLNGLMQSSKNPTIAPYAKEGEVTLRVTASANSADQAKMVSEPIIELLKARLGDNLYGINAASLPEAVVNLLKENKLKIAVAESCTGGYISKLITDVSGSSEVFDCGITAYANSIKEKVLGVSAETLKKYGAVSKQTAMEMAEGVRALANADIGISTTGIAGPSGGTPEKPVGLVYIACAGKDKTECQELKIGRGGDERDYVRLVAAKSALDLARRHVIALL